MADDSSPSSPRASSPDHDLSSGWQELEKPKEGSNVPVELGVIELVEDRDGDDGVNVSDNRTVDPEKKGKNSRLDAAMGGSEEVKMDIQATANTANQDGDNIATGDGVNTTEVLDDKDKGDGALKSDNRTAVPEEGNREGVAEKSEEVKVITQGTSSNVAANEDTNVGTTGLTEDGEGDKALESENRTVEPEAKNPEGAARESGGENVSVTTANGDGADTGIDGTGTADKGEGDEALKSDNRTKDPEAAEVKMNIKGNQDGHDAATVEDGGDGDGALKSDNRTVRILTPEPESENKPDLVHRELAAFASQDKSDRSEIKGGEGDEDEKKNNLSSLTKQATVAQLNVAEVDSKKKKLIPRDEKSCCGYCVKFFTFMMLPLLLPVLCLDIVASGWWGSKNVILFGYFAEKRNIRSSLLTYDCWSGFKVSVFLFGFVGCYIIGGGVLIGHPFSTEIELFNTRLDLVIARTLIFVPLIPCAIYILCIVLGTPSFNSIDYPSSRMRHTISNWLVILAMLYDFVFMTFLLLTPLIKNAFPDLIPVGGDTFATEILLNFGSSQKEATYWAAVAIALFWLWLCCFLYYKYDLCMDKDYVYHTTWLKVCVNQCSNTFFLFTMGNLLQGLQPPESHLSPAYGKSELYKNIVIGISAFLTMFYTMTSVLYGSSLVQRSDNYMQSTSLDLKFMESYTIAEKVFKVVVTCMNIFFNVNFTASEITLGVTLGCCIIMIVFIFCRPPAAMNELNVLKLVHYTYLAFVSLCGVLTGLIGEDRGTAQLMFIVTQIGTLLALILGVGYVKCKRKEWAQKDHDVYMWGFAPTSKSHTMWWRTERFRKVESDLEFSMASCGLLTPFTAAVSKEGMLLTCGVNDHGQLGNGSDGYRYFFTHIGSLWHDKITIKRVSCGGEHVLVLDQNGAVWSFGKGHRGQLGLGNKFTYLNPTPVMDLKDHKCTDVTCGSAASLAITQEGKVFIWGYNKEGCLGLGDEKQVATVVPQGIRKEKEYINLKPELVEFRQKSDKAKGDSLYTGKAVRAWMGHEHTIVVMADFTVWTFGTGTYGKLGHGDEVTCNRPKRLVCKDENGNEIKVRFAECGGQFTAIITVEGHLYTFGNGESGQLGHGPEVKQLCAPQKLMENVILVACGLQHTLVVKEVEDVDQLWGFGLNNSWQLGIGGKKAADVLWTPSEIPIDPEHLVPSETMATQLWNRVMGRQRTPQKIVHLDAGLQHSVVVTTNGNLLTCGTSNQFCGLGCTVGNGLIKDGGDFATRIKPILPQPTRVPSVDLNVEYVNHHRDRQISQIAIGLDHYIILSAKGHVFSFGATDVGQTGHSANNIMLMKSGLRDERLSREFADLESQLANARETISTQTQNVTLSRITIELTRLDEGVKEEVKEDSGFQHNPISAAINVIEADTAVPPLILPTPQRLIVPNNVRIVSVSCGWGYTAMVCEHGGLYTFGNGACGQLGHGEGVTQVWTPRRVEAMDKNPVTMVACGVFHTAMLTRKNQIHTCGSDGGAVNAAYGNTLPKCSGMLALGPGVDERWEPTLVDTASVDKHTLKNIRWKYIACHWGTTAAISYTNDLFTSGHGHFGANGHDKENREYLSRVSFDHCIEESENYKRIEIRQVACGLIHTVAVSLTGNVYTWGFSAHAQLGHGKQVAKKQHRIFMPKKVDILKKEKISEAAAGTYQTAFMTTDGRLFICGSHLLGALGVGDVSHYQWKPRVVGKLLGRQNYGIALGNHNAVAW